MNAASVRAPLAAGLLGLMLASCGSPTPPPPQLAGTFTTELRPSSGSAPVPRLGSARITLDGYRVTVVLTDPVSGERTYVGTRSLLEHSLSATRGNGGPCDGVVLAAEAVQLSFYSGEPKARGELTYPTCENGRVAEDSAKRWTLTLR